jgi:hypothetical protein
MLFWLIDGFGVIHWKEPFDRDWKMRTSALDHKTCQIRESKDYQFLKQFSDMW